MKLKIQVMLNPSDIHDQSDDRDMESDTQEYTINNAEELNNPAMQSLEHFHQKFGFRRGEDRTVTLWNTETWNRKIVPNVKYKVILDGKERIMSPEELNGFRLTRIYKWLGRNAQAIYRMVVTTTPKGKQRLSPRFVTWKILKE